MKENANGTHAVHGLGKCFGVLQKFLRGGLEDGKITLEVVELWIGGLWKPRRGTRQRPMICVMHNVGRAEEEGEAAMLTL